MKSAFLSLSLLASLPIALAVQLNITEVKWLDGRPSRTQIVEVPYTDATLLPKDQPCIALPYLTREVNLITENLTVPTRCWMFTQTCRNSLSPISNVNPYVYLRNAPAFAVKCYEEEDPRAN
ncbi:hypothetical protein BJY04DRAFT_131385 [Aspergillus karnatakaensis]|uniref:uncharacterized protein n=1 Tax=Aspergillus karnatakaensis TaxID=1810916 RepID=UPI003CCC9479